MINKIAQYLHQYFPTLLVMQTLSISIVRQYNPIGNDICSVHITRSVFLILRTYPKSFNYMHLVKENINWLNRIKNQIWPAIVLTVSLHKCKRRRLSIVLVEK